MNLQGFRDNVCIKEDKRTKTVNRVPRMTRVPKLTRSQLAKRAYYEQLHKELNRWDLDFITRNQRFPDGGHLNSFAQKYHYPLQDVKLAMRQIRKTDIRY